MSFSAGVETCGGGGEAMERVGDVERPGMRCRIVWSTKGVSGRLLDTVLCIYSHGNLITYISPSSLRSSSRAASEGGGDNTIELRAGLAIAIEPAFTAPFACCRFLSLKI